VVVLELVELFLVLIVVVPWIWVLYDAIRWDGQAWGRAGRTKIPWILFILVLPPFGVLTYLILARPDLMAAAAPERVAIPEGAGSGAEQAAGAQENPLLLMRRNTVVAIGLLLAAIAIAGVLGVLRLWRLA
jgi:hypothetical protein